MMGAVTPETCRVTAVNKYLHAVASGWIFINILKLIECPPPPSEYRGVHEIMLEKYGAARQATDDNKIRRYLWLQTHTQNMQNVLLFHSNNGKANAPQFQVCKVHCLSYDFAPVSSGLYRVAPSRLTHFKFEFCAGAIACRGLAERGTGRGEDAISYGQSQWSVGTCNNVLPVFVVSATSLGLLGRPTLLYHIFSCGGS